MLLVPLLALLLLVVLPTALWFSFAPGASEHWPPHVVGSDTIAQGQYRDAVVPRLHAGGPPREVRLAALGSWVLGAMFVPGLALGVFGLTAWGAGVLLVPVLVLAWQLFFLGRELLLARPAAAAKARSLARFARVLNAIVLAACVLGVAYIAPDLAGHAARSEALVALAAALATAVYAGVSLGHAALLVRAAAAIDARSFINPEGLSGVRVDAALVTGDLPSAEAASDAEADAAARARRG